MADSDSLARARSAIARRDWPIALEAFRELDQAALVASDLESLAWAYAWTGDLERGIRAWEQAFAGYFAAADWDAAAVSAFWIAFWYDDKGSHAVTSGWHRRLERIAADHRTPRTIGYAELIGAWGTFQLNELQTSEARVNHTIALAESCADHDLAAFATAHLARICLARGDRDEGLHWGNTAAAAAVSGELSPGAVFVVYCSVIALYFGIGEVKAAAEWTEALQHWCDEQRLFGFPGICRVERAKILAMRGHGQEARKEAERACRELDSFAVGLAGPAHYQRGELLLREGDLAGAEAAFARAHELGANPQPGFALLLLARGEAAAAHASIRTALDHGAWNPADRVRLLPALVETALADGDAAAARSAAEEIASIADLYRTPALEAAAAFARGLVRFGNPEEEPGRSLNRARELWHSLGLPYEVARTRLLLAEICRRRGDLETALLEQSAAESACRTLGLGVETIARGISALFGPAMSGRTRLHIQLLGAFRITIDGRPIPDSAWRQSRPAELVKLLALADRHTLHREQIMEALWPDLAPDDAAANLYRVAHRARQSLGSGNAIVVQGGEVKLWPDAEVTTDLEQLESSAATTDPAECGAILDRFPGELLPGDLYQEWTSVRRERVHALRLRLLRAAGRWEEVVEMEPLDESAHRALMKQHLERGERATALRHYERLRAYLDNELGIDPEPKTAALYNEIKSRRRA